MTGKACLALLNDSAEAVGFSKMGAAKNLSVNGTLTPDHVIRTKPFAWIIKDDLAKSAKDFMKRYDAYFQKNKSKGIIQLDKGPKWALWPDYGTICFGTSKKQAQIISDINRHTIRAMQTSFNLDHWQPISFRDLFDVEYWELEQAKLKKDNQPPEFQGKIALITGTASGIGYACTQKLLENGCAVIGLDKNQKVTELFDA